ncbi:MAG: glycosyltransferase family protein [Dehalococcoidia bacterium]
MTTNAQPRIAIFTHDTYGLGHVQRCLRIIEEVSGQCPEAAILLITGSPSLSLLRALPKNADYVKIPTIVQTGLEESHPPHLPIELNEIVPMRNRMTRMALQRFMPDVFLVDNFPLGARRELNFVFQTLRDSSTKIVLGLRDVLETPEKVRLDWTRDNVYEVLETTYDHILVYGMQEIHDTAREYGIPPATAQKIRYCGYVAPDLQVKLSPEEVRRELGVEGKFLLATVGGGGDGLPLLQTLLKAVPFLPDIPVIMITGPLMGDPELAELQQQAVGLTNLRMLDFVEDLPSYLAAADVVVSMGGYNTSAEIMAVQANAVMVPRTWRFGEHRSREKIRESGEQRVRAQALAELGIVEMLDPSRLGPRPLAAKILQAWANPRGRSDMPLNLSGIKNAASFLLETAGKRAVGAY